MFGLLLLVNFASIIAFATGLINPKLVLRGEKRTRRKSTEIYLSAFVLSFIGMLVFAPKPEPVVITPVAKPKPAPVQEAKPSPIQEVIPTPTPTPTPAKATPTPTPEFVTFDPSVCKSDRYLPINGASIALYTTCQYLNTDLIQPESVSVVTGAKGNGEPLVLELQAESGFEKVLWRDYNLAPESGKDVCVEYKDESVSCLAFSNPDETAGTQIQPQVTTSTLKDAKCEDFAMQEQAQAALPANPQLDRDGNGTACDSVLSGGGGSYVHYRSSGSSYHYTRRRRRRR